MKDLLRYYYDMDVNSVESNENIYHFKYNDYTYYFVPFNRNLKELSSIMNLGLKCFNSHKIIQNKFENYISVFNENEYILLKIIKLPNLVIDFTTLVNNCSTYLINNDDSNNWSILWQKKVDYLEKQIRMLGNGKVDLINSFSYYVGLAENAISFYNNIGEQKHILSLQHHRIFYPNIWLNYGNPLSFIVDYPERDIAESLKYTFFYGSEDQAYVDFIYLYKINKLNKFSWKLLLSRLLYPTYYFDLFENMLVKGLSSKKLLVIISKVDNYEKFLGYCYTIINKRFEINYFPLWLL